MNFLNKKKHICVYGSFSLCLCLFPLELETFLPIFKSFLLLIWIRIQILIQIIISEQSSTNPEQILTQFGRQLHYFRRFTFI